MMTDQPRPLAKSDLVVDSIETVRPGLEAATLADLHAIRSSHFDFGRIDQVIVRAVAGTHRIGQRITVTLTPAEDPA